MNRTLKDATVRRHRYAGQDELPAHPALFLDAYSHAFADVATVTVAVFWPSARPARSSASASLP